MADDDNVRDCDYELNCTPLFKAIEEAAGTKDYGPVLTFLDSYTWHGAFFTRNEGSPAEQAGTWVTKYVDGKVKWSQLPLHLAIVCGAPFEVIAKLVELYPAALKCTDDQHMLPFHLALRYDADDNTIACLLEKFPDAVNAKGKNDRTAVECALRSGNEARGRILNFFVEKTKARLSSQVINERNKLKKIIETLTEENEKIFAELETQYAVISKMNKDLSKATFELESRRKDKGEMETELLAQILELEKAKKELETEMKDKIEKLNSKRMVENLELQMKIDELQAEKNELEKLNQMHIQDEANLRAALESIQDRITGIQDLDDWADLKVDIDTMQSARIVEARKTAADEIAMLRGNIVKSLNSSVLKNDLRELKTSVEKLRADENTVRTSSDVDKLRSEIHQLRKAFKDRSDTSKLKLELTVLKKAMETELTNPEGKTKEQIEKIRQAIRFAEEEKFEHKTVDELTQVKEKLHGIKKTLQNDELIRNVKKDMAEIQATLSNDLVVTDGKAKAELESLKRGIEATKIALEDVESWDELIAIQKKVADIKEQMKNREKASKLLQEAMSMRKTLDNEVKKSVGRTQKELEQIKKEVKVLVDRGLNDNKDTDELAKMKIELEMARSRLNDTKHATKTQEELKDLRDQLAMELNGVQEKTQRELTEVKKAIKSVDLEHKESRLLKKELTDEIKKANAKAEKELLKMKKKIDAINVKVLESKQKEEWESIRKEMEVLKSELNEKQSNVVSQKEQELAAMKKVMDAVKLKKMQKMHEDNMNALQEEMIKLKEEMKTKEQDSVALKQEMKGLQKNAKIIGLYVKKREQKKGLKKKMFARGEAAKEEGTQPASGSSPEDKAGLEIDTTKEENFSPREVPTFLPPSLSNTEHSPRGSSSSDSNDRHNMNTEPKSEKEEEEKTKEDPTKKEIGKPPKPAVAAAAKDSRETISGGGGVFSLLSIPMRSVKTAAARLTGTTIAGSDASVGDNMSVKKSGSKDTICSSKHETTDMGSSVDKPVEMRRTLSKTIKRTGEVEIESIDVVSS